MALWKSARRRRVEAALQELCTSQGDLLALKGADIAAVAVRHGLGSRYLDLLRLLLVQAIDSDVHRLTEIFRASGQSNMPPPRLVADWAIRIGLPAREVTGIVARSNAPVALAKAYLETMRIDVPQRQTLEDIAVAYGAPPEKALCWIEAAVNAEIDRLAEMAHPAGSIWQRFAGS